MKITFVFLSFLMASHHYTVVQGAPPVEGCPQDSILEEGICKCNLEFCVKPPCLSTLTIESEGTNEPGNCCPTYSCENCFNETRIDGQCPCAPGAVLNARNKCECIDGEKRLTEGECKCDASRCKLPQICDKKSVLVTEKEENACCMRSICIQCPDDSFAFNYNSDVIEDKCVCYPCKSECGNNQIKIIVKPGKNIPSNCCDLYKCEPIVGNKSCTHDNVTYADGNAWPTQDEICKCDSGVSVCTKRYEDDFLSCHAEGKVYKHGEFWMQDVCTNCTCIDGTAKCIAHMCHVTEEKKCMSLNNCNKTCPNGFKIGRSGCEICRCRTLPENILKDYNVTWNDIVRLLDQSRTSTMSTAEVPSTTRRSITNTTSETATDSSTSDFNSSFIYIILVISGFVCGGLAMLALSTCIHRRRSFNISRYQEVKNENNNLTKNYRPIKESENLYVPEKY